jgi:hypothetical protein
MFVHVFKTAVPALPYAPVRDGEVTGDWPPQAEIVCPQYGLQNVEFVEKGHFSAYL